MNRRRFLTLTSIVATTGLTGCASFSSKPESTEGTSGDGTTAGGTAPATTTGTAGETSEDGTTTSPDSYRSFRYGPLNLGTKDTATGPTERGTVAWNYQGKRFVVGPPVVADGTVYAGDGGGGVFSLTADGQENWRRSVGAHVVASPALADGTLVVPVSVGKGEGKVVGMDPASGETLWSIPTDNQMVGSPTVLDGTVYVATYTGTLYALGLSDGSQQWTVEIKGEVPNTPTVANGSIYLGSDNGVYAFAMSDGSQQWHQTAPESFVSLAPPLTEDTLFVSDSKGTLWAIATDGSVRWNQSIGGYAQSSPAVADGTIYTGSLVKDSDGYNGIVAAYSMGQEKQWEVTMKGTKPSSPVVVDNTVFVADETAGVTALGASDGRKQWSWKGTDAKAVDIVPSPAVADGTAYVGGYDGRLYALRK